MCYCALSGKSFRVKLCLWLNYICFTKLLCESEFCQLVYFLQPLKVLPSSAYRLGWPYGRWAMLLFVPQWTFPHLGASHMKLLNTRVHLGVYTFLLGMSVTSLCSPLGSNPAWQWSLKISLVLLRISPFLNRKSYLYRSESCLYRTFAWIGEPIWIDCWSPNRKLLRCRIKIWELCERCDMSRSAWILWYIEYWWVPVCVILNVFIVMNKSYKTKNYMLHWCIYIL